MPPREPAKRSARARDGEREIDGRDQLARRQHGSPGTGEEVIQRHLPRAARTDEIEAGTVRQENGRCVGGRRCIAQVAGKGRAIANLNRADRPRGIDQRRKMLTDAAVLNYICHHGPCADADASIDLGDISAQLRDPFHIDDDRGPFEAFSHAHQKIGASGKESRAGPVLAQKGEQRVE